MIIMIVGGSSYDGGCGVDDDGGVGGNITIEVKNRKSNAINKLFPVLVLKRAQWAINLQGHIFTVNSINNKCERKSVRFSKIDGMHVLVR